MLGVWGQGEGPAVCLLPEAGWGLVSISRWSLPWHQEEMGILRAARPVQGGQCHRRGCQEDTSCVLVVSLDPLSMSFIAGSPLCQVALFLVMPWGVEAVERT